MRLSPMTISHFGPMKVELRDDPAALQNASTDFGRIVRRTPRMVAHPRTADEVTQILAFANRTGHPVSVQGMAHTQGGQSLTDGILISTRRLDRIGPVERGTVRVQAGVLWRDLVRHVQPHGFLPRVLTSHHEVSVGGTLSVAGVGVSSFRYGSQADNVEALDVVTADGRQVRCSPTERPELFDGVRCGLGQLAVITAAQVRLRAAPPQVRVFHLLYDHLDPLQHDWRLLLSENHAASIGCVCVPHVRTRAGSRRVRWFYLLAVTVEGDAAPPDRAALRCRRIRHVGVSSPLAHIASMVGTLHPVDTAAPVHPWVCGLLPWRAGFDYVARILDRLPFDGLLAQARVVLGAFCGSVLQAPMFVHPGQPLMLGVGIFPWIRRSPLTLALALARMREASQLLTDSGGKRYPSGWFEYNYAQWRTHYGALWPRLLEWKADLDPGGILNPGFIQYQEPAKS